MPCSALNGCLVVVGGDIVCACAQAVGLVSRFLPSGIESIRAVLETASRVCYTIDMQNRNNAEMDTVLNYTFTGIMRVSRDGTVSQAQNRIVSTTQGLAMNERNLLKTDEHGKTTREGIFAAGDAFLGVKTVVEAVRNAKIVAEEMDRYLQEKAAQRAESK